MHPDLTKNPKDGAVSHIKPKPGGGVVHLGQNSKENFKCSLYLNVLISTKGILSNTCAMYFKKFIEISYC